MTSAEIASEVLQCVGGKDNVVSNSLCMTRLRVTVANPTLVDAESLERVPSVLGTVGRGSDGIEVVFGPATVGPVFDSFSSLTGLPNAFDAPYFADLSRSEGPLRVSVGSWRDRAGAPAAAPASPQQSGPVGQPEELSADELAALLEGAPKPANQPLAASRTASQPGEDPEGPNLLVINGPNINMLGIREPELYGRSDFAALLRLCHDTAKEAGFVVCDCYQSNHEGDLVDRIQDAYGIYDGIVINPGAYTHTSVAILDALKSVSIPAIEVHITDVDSREDFRQVSYVRLACFETITGMGIEGYAKAIRDMAAHIAGE